MAIKNLLVSFKDLFISLWEQSAYLYRKFCKVEIPRTFIYFSTLKGKVKNLYDTNLELGLFHLYNNNLHDAYIRFFLMSIIFKKKNMEEIYVNLFKVLVIQNKKKKAKNILNKIKEKIQDSNHIFYSRQDFLFYEKLLYSIDSLEGVDHSILVDKFEFMAQYYVEQHIIPKDYCGHKIVTKYVMQYFHKSKKNLRILDLGCGTGIVSQFLKMNKIGSYFVGVDFSQKMIEISTNIKSNKQKVFNILYCDEMIKFVNNINILYNKDESSNEENEELKTFDIVLTIDCLHYYGDFSKKLSLIRNTLYNKKSLFITTVLANNNISGFEYVNSVEHKFSYSRSFLCDIFTNEGFNILDIEKVEFFKNCYYWCIVCQKKV